MMTKDWKYIGVALLASTLLDLLTGLSLFFTVAAFQAVVVGGGWVPAVTGGLGLVAISMMSYWNYRMLKAHVELFRSSRAVARAMRLMDDVLRRYYEERFGLN